MTMITNKKAFTLIEVCMSVAILSMVLGAVGGVMMYARRESDKGNWIMQGIGQLRNATRQVGVKMKEMSYPSTVVATTSRKDNKKFIQSVISFKEWREYDFSGRLRNLFVNGSKAYEMYVSSGDNTTDKTSKILMRFPICSPEKDMGDSRYTPGKILWTVFTLEPGQEYDFNKLGSVYMEEYESEYDTRNEEEKRAYSLGKWGDEFSSRSAKFIRKRELISDVSGVEIKSFEIKASRGNVAGKTSVDKIQNVVRFKIYCKHPKDARIQLSDMCSITTEAEICPL